MVTIAPFRGLRYDPSRLDPSAVIAPPYDVVGEDAVAALHARSPYNVGHVESPRADGGGDPYAHAAALLDAWQREGVLIREERPAYYVYEQRTAIGSERIVRRCCFARMQLSPFAEGVVRPHEHTMSGPKADRLALLSATRVNISPLLVMYRDASGSAARAIEGATAGEPVYAATDDRGDEHLMWIVDDPAAIEAITTAAAGSTATIADGHHRYETALNYLGERGEGDDGARWVLAGLVAEDEPGLVVLPTHRLLPDAQPPADFAGRLGELYELEAFDTVEALWAAVQAGASNPGTFGQLGLGGSGLHLLRARSAEAIDARMPGEWSPASRALDVLILNETILAPLLGLDAAAFTAGRVEFSEDVEEAWEWTQAAPGRLAFLVNSTRVDQVVSVADAGEVMPQKSTFFYPKLATGMVLNPLDE
ncbi:MAG: DUF1015 domain-containing protein [Chloroflexi bacterium]|nr:DUF1015 domain-containing protein [Chloroflexota bacterium]